MQIVRATPGLLSMCQFGVIWYDEAAIGCEWSRHELIFDRIEPNQAAAWRVGGPASGAKLMLQRDILSGRITHTPPDLIIAGE